MISRQIWIDPRQQYLRKIKYPLFPCSYTYGFSPVLWVALGKGETVVSAYKCEDPLCRWMFFSCTPDNTLSIQNVSGENETVAWSIEKLTDKYIQSVRRPRNVRVSPKQPVRNEVAKRLEDYDYYRQLECRNGKMTEEARQKWIEQKRKEREGITIDTKDVGPPSDSNGASTSGVWGCVKNVSLHWHGWTEVKKNFENHDTWIPGVQEMNIPLHSLFSFVGKFSGKVSSFRPCQCKLIR